MADFNYAELCLAMDHLYGLKDIHHIDSFDALLYQLGIREMMKSTSAADAAVFVISAVLGDGSVSALNPMTGAMATAVYNVDLNLDHQYGQEDQGLTTKKCLLSHLSGQLFLWEPCALCFQEQQSGHDHRTHLGRRELCCSSDVLCLRYRIPDLRLYASGLYQEWILL